MELYSLADIARESKVDDTTARAHYRRGLLPAPLASRGRAFYWDKSGFTEAIRYFKSRTRYDRLPTGPAS